MKAARRLSTAWLNTSRLLNMSRLAAIVVLVTACAADVDSDEVIVEQEQPVFVSDQAIAPGSMAESNFSSETEEGPPKGDEGLQTSGSVEPPDDDQLEPDPEPWQHNDTLGGPSEDGHADDDENSHDGCGDGMHEPP
jgi:hypothetical protein